jgi:hypothetical protein
LLAHILGLPRVVMTWNKNDPVMIELRKQYLVIPTTLLVSLEVGLTSLSMFKMPVAHGDNVISHVIYGGTGESRQTWRVAIASYNVQGKQRQASSH